MTKIIATIFTITVSFAFQAQNLYPKMLDNCITDHFCLDCGDIQANVDKGKFSQLLAGLNASETFKGKDKVIFQVLVDSLGHGCVLSHPDVYNSKTTRKIVELLNQFDGYIPATTKGVHESRTSFDLSFQVKGGKMTGKVERVDVKAFEASFDRPRSPEIYNTSYTYQNKNLSSYEITCWNSNNSSLPNNQNDNIAIDSDGMIWLTIDGGLVKFDGQKFKREEQGISSNADGNYYNIGTDNQNLKWVHFTNGIYSFNDEKWTQYDPKEIGIDGAYSIVNNPSSNEVFFCSDEGLTVYKNGSWSNINMEKVKELPSNRVNFARRDSKNRIWIGTFSGTVMIDENGNATNFNHTETILKGKCITSMDEDEAGNLYFSLYEFDRKDKTKINNDEGIAIRSTDGSFRQYTTSNSGMPFNHVTQVLYDKNEKVLWIATDRAGLVRFDLKDQWENYHSDNSMLPTSYISAMAFDKKGVLYLATRQGLVRMNRK